LTVQHNTANYSEVAS